MPPCSHLHSAPVAALSPLGLSAVQSDQGEGGGSDETPTLSACLGVPVGRALILFHCRLAGL